MLRLFWFWLWISWSRPNFCFDFFVTDCFSEQKGRLLFLGKLKGKACWYCEWISFILPSSSTDQRAAQVVLVQVEVGWDRKGPMIFIWVISKSKTLWFWKYFLKVFYLHYVISCVSMLLSFEKYRPIYKTEKSISFSKCILGNRNEWSQNKLSETFDTSRTYFTVQKWN